VERRSIQVLEPWSAFVLYSLTTLNGEDYDTEDTPIEDWPAGLKQEFWVKGLGFDVKVHEVQKPAYPKPNPDLPNLPPGVSYGSPMILSNPLLDDNRLYWVHRPENFYVSPPHTKPLWLQYEDAISYLQGLGYSDFRQGEGISTWWGIRVRGDQTPNPKVEVRMNWQFTQRPILSYSYVEYHYPLPSNPVAAPVKGFRLTTMEVYALCDIRPFSNSQFYLYDAGASLPELFIGPFGLAGYYDSFEIPSPLPRSEWSYPGYDENGVLTCSVPSGKYTDPSLPPDAPENQPPDSPTSINNEAYISASPDQVFALVKWGESEEEDSTDYAELIYKGLDIAGALTNLGQTGHADDWRKDAVNLAPTASIEIEGSNPCLRDFLAATNVTLREGNLYTLDLNQNIGTAGEAQSLKTLLESAPGESGPRRLTVDITIVHVAPDNDNPSACQTGTGTPLPCRIPVPGRGRVLGVAVMPK